MTKIDFSKSYQNFPEGFVPWIDLLPECIIPSDLLRLMDVLEIFFYTNTCMCKLARRSEERLCPV